MIGPFVLPYALLLVFAAVALSLFVGQRIARYKKPKHVVFVEALPLSAAGAPDRAAVKVHDIGLLMKKNAAGETGFEVMVGGGLGRSPYLGPTVRDWVSKQDLLSYLEANMRVYNRHGRRDNKYKARIKILVNELGEGEYRRQVEEEFAHAKGGVLRLPQEELDRIAALVRSSVGFDAKRGDQYTYARGNLAGSRFDHAQAGLGGHHAGPGAHEQRVAGKIAQPLERCTDRRLVHAQADGGS